MGRDRLNALDLLGNLLGRLGRLIGQVLDLLGDDGESLARLAGARGLRSSRSAPEDWFVRRCLEISSRPLPPIVWADPASPVMTCVGSFGFLHRRSGWSPRRSRRWTSPCSRLISPTDEDEFLGARTQRTEHWSKSDWLPAVADDACVVAAFHQHRRSRFQLKLSIDRAGPVQRRWRNPPPVPVISLAIFHNLERLAVHVVDRIVGRLDPDFLAAFAETLVLSPD